MIGRRKKDVVPPGEEDVLPSPGPTTAPVAPPDGTPVTLEDARPRPLSEQPVVRIGLYAWALIGVGLLLISVGEVLGRLFVVFVPLLLALFPAAVLAPPTMALRRRGLKRGAAAAIVFFGSFLLVYALGAVLAPTVAGELGDLGTKVSEGYEQVSNFMATGPFGLDPVAMDDLVERGREFLADAELGERAAEAAVVVVEGFAGLALLLFALFFYLKDGDRIATWGRDLFPKRMRRDVEAIGERAWFTIGAYIRGQLLIAFVDAVLIGIGIAIIRVPLALPLAVLVFIGGLFPIVGALVSGAVAVLVALATAGPIPALIVLAVVVAVQQTESHLLAPLVLGRATELHPLAVIAALAAGGVLLGVLGAFIAVPVAASVARGVGYLRTRVPG